LTQDDIIFKGLILKESLEDTRVLDLLHITRTETWQVSNAAQHQPAAWTALSFEANESQADSLARHMSRSLKAEGWYVNASTATHVYVIFPGKVFKYRKGDTAQRETAKRYGRSLSIPESQLDWSE
jgi:hypothetical protein